jgi:putative DNA primase/helicase
MLNNINEFRNAMRAAGLAPPDAIEPGTLHRFPGIDKGKGNEAGWCRMFADGLGGVYGDWSNDLNASWQAARSAPFTPAEREALNRQIAEARASAEAERKQRQSEAAAKAVSIWQAATPAPSDHAYLVRKGIKPHGAKLHNGALVIAVREGADIHSAQFIGDDGTKRFLTDGRVAGGYFSIGTTKGAAALCIAEGFATGATLHEITGYPVAVAFNAGNLEAVALAMRAKLPDMPIILCGELDPTGLTKSRAAALAIGARLALPDFGETRPEGATDFNDLATHSGAEAVKAAIEAATIPARETYQAASFTASNDDMARGRYVALIPATEIHPEPIEWLWNGWLAAGKFHLLGGAPGTGKTTLAIAMAATLSSGGRWPDGTTAEAGNVLIWSGEDDPANTLVPRLILSGGNRGRVFFVGNTNGSGGELPFDPATDMQRLTEAAHKIGNVRLLIVDPIVSAVAGNSHNNAETRRCLQPLVELGTALNCAVLGITHFTKGTGGSDPVERVTGSIAFAALARVVLVAAKKREPQEGEATRMLARAKSNIGQDDGGFSYDLHQAELQEHRGVIASYVVWGDEMAGSAREMLATAEMADDEGGALSDTSEWLKEILTEEGGQLDKQNVMLLAKGAGFSERTIQRARGRLGIVATMTGFGKSKRSIWKLPIEVETVNRANHANKCHMENLGTYGTNGAQPQIGEVL